MCTFQDFPRPIMSIFHVFPGLFNPVDIEQVSFLYSTEYVTVHNYTKQQTEASLTVENDNVCQGRKTCTWVRNGNHLVHLHDFPGPRPNSVTFQACKILILNSMTFQDVCTPYQLP